MNSNSNDADSGASLSDVGLDTIENAQRRAQYWKAEHLAANAEIERLRRALMDCDHQTDSMRVWGGMEWKYNPPQAWKIHKIARSALEGSNNQVQRPAESGSDAT